MPRTVVQSTSQAGPHSGGAGQTPAGAGRHDIVAVQRVRLEGGLEDTAIPRTQRREGERTAPQVLPSLPAPRVCRKASDTAWPRPGHTGNCPLARASCCHLCFTFPLSSPGGLCWARPPRRSRAEARSALPGSCIPGPGGFQPLVPARCQLREQNSSARLLNFHPLSHKSFCGYGQENPRRPFTELGSGLAWPGRIFLDLQ